MTPLYVTQKSLLTYATRQQLACFQDDYLTLCGDVTLAFKTNKKMYINSICIIYILNGFLRLIQIV